VGLLGENASIAFPDKAHKPDSTEKVLALTLLEVETEVDARAKFLVYMLENKKIIL
jgi:hypothetical protein